MNVLSWAVVIAVGGGLCILALSLYWVRSPLVFEHVPLPITDAQQPVPYDVEVFASGLEVPWSMVWTSRERMLIAERPGRIRVIENGALLEEPLHIFTEVSTGGEEGLMSLAVHPQYAHNQFIYAVYAYQKGDAYVDRVVRFVDAGDHISDMEVILDDIPAARFHAGSRLGFGPDGMLYITTGDATDRAIAQDLASLGGKILRLHDDGTVPQDNPFPNSPVWSYGHRNAQGIAWHPESGELYETEHGPSGFDGPGGGDEVNRIQKGANYGWPLVSHEKTLEGTVAPIALYTPAEAPGSALFYSGAVFPQFAHDFFYGALRGEGLWRLKFDTESPDTLLGEEKSFANEYGRIRDVAEGPDGLIYFATSNRDGRGRPDAADDRILRLVPRGE